MIVMIVIDICVSGLFIVKFLSDAWFLDLIRDNRLT
jgi:hypothetical protein